SRVLNARSKLVKLDVASPTSTSFLRWLTASQDAVAARIRRTIPAARIRWRYRIVLDGLAVVVPRADLPALSRVRGVRRVYLSASGYAPLLDRSPQLIGADQLWGPTLATAGEGMKIAIL